MGLGLRLGFGLGAIAATSGVQWFLDSAAAGGGDGSAAAPYNSISALLADGDLDSNQVINIERGSTFRETLSLSGYDGMTVQASGAGADPIISAFDVVTGWSLTSGRSNTYEVSFTPDHGSGTINDLLGFKENGVPLVYQSSVANCDSNPGSYAVTDYADDGVAQTVYIHPYDSTVPGSDGKTYEITKRVCCITTGDGCTIRGIRATGAIADDGVIIAGGNTLIDDCIIEHGNNHHIGIFGGSGEVRNSTLRYADTGQLSGDATMVVFFSATTQSPKLTGLVSGCTMIGGHPNDTQAIKTQGVFAHDGDATISYSNITVKDCACTNLTHPASAAADLVTVTGCTTAGGKSLGASATSANLRLIDSFMTYVATTNPAPGKWIRASGCRFYDRVGTIMVTHSGSGSEATFDYCSFDAVSSSNGALTRINVINSEATGTKLGMNNCVVKYAGRVFVFINQAAFDNAVLDLDNNIYWWSAFNALATVLTGFDSFSQWQTRTGQESNSLRINPAYAGDTSAGVFTTGANEIIRADNPEGDLAAGVENYTA
jgi:hypothetical protein